jgi:alpha-beta hydrolase superfamily lysophospholipase
MIKETILHKEFYISASDGKPLFLRAWQANEVINPKAIIQIAHGLSEHSGRYHEFASYMVRHGYGVIANDHRGHGKTAEGIGEYGFFGEANGWDRTVEDLLECTLWARKAWGEVPVILLGHSMGSFMARRYAQRFGNELQGLILSGTTAINQAFVQLGIWITKLEVRRIGMKAPSPVLNKLIFGQRNRQVEFKRTAFGWLSRDSEQVDHFVNDPLCIKAFCTYFFYDLISGFKELSDERNEQFISKDLPIFIFSGEKDPVGGYSRGVLKVCRKYQDIGLRDVTCKIYPEGRHEMLNELNRDEVFEDILNWIEAHG